MDLHISANCDGPLKYPGFQPKKKIKDHTDEMFSVDSSRINASEEREPNRHAIGSKFRRGETNPGNRCDTGAKARI